MSHSEQTLRKKLVERLRYAKIIRIYSEELKIEQIEDTIISQNKNSKIS